MNGLTFVPLDGVEVLGDDVGSFAELFEDRGRIDNASAFLMVRHEDWSPRPLYYVFARDDLEGLWRATADENLTIDRLTRDRLFEILDVHEHTEALNVPAGVEPEARAVVLDVAGQPEGVWADVQPPPVAANGGDRRGGDEEVTRSAPLPYAADEGRRGDEEPAVDAFWRRTPHMDLSEEEPLSAGQALVASVFLDTEAASPEEDVQEVVVDLPDDLETVDIDVVLIASEHFAIQGASRQTLSMDRDDERSPDLTFDLQVIDEPPLDTRASLTAYLSYRDRPCGFVHREVAIEDAAVPEAAEPAERREPVPGVAIDGHAQPADVTVQVLEGEEQDRRHYFVLVKTTLVDDFTMAEPEPWVFHEGTDTFVTGLMAQFTKKGASAWSRTSSLNGAGVQFWNKAPECFTTLFWRLVDEGVPPRTVFVASAESNIPWELMIPRRTLATGEIEQREPLGVEFAVGRWAHPDHRSPKQQDPIEDSYVVAPAYRVRKLKNSPAEAKWVCDNFGGVAVTPALGQQLEALFAERAVGLVHFIAHGKSEAGQEQTLALEEDEVLFSSQIVGGMPNLERAFQEKAPLVFINACEVGRTTPTLVGPGGFAQAFLNAGARGVVAPLWSVKDSVAHTVALDFYGAALEEPSRPFAEILTEIRKRAYAEGGGEDTYAAYCWYGDPLTALEASA